MLGLGKKKKITQGSEAIAPLKQIVNDLQAVANHQHSESETKKMQILMLQSQQDACDKECALADEQVKKMSDFFGITPDE